MNGHNKLKYLAFYANLLQKRINYNCKKLYDTGHGMTKIKRSKLTGQCGGQVTKQNAESINFNKLFYE
jgi:hypothetical protein